MVNKRGRLLVMMERINNWLYHHPEFCDLATVLTPLLFIFLLMICMNSCSTIKEVPIQYIDRVEYKDTTIYIKDTIKVEVPKEIIKEIVPEDTTSILRTSVALSEAKVEKGMLKHRLEQKGTIPAQIDTIIKLQYVDRYIEKEKPVIQTVEKPIRDNIFWFSILFNLTVVLLFAFRIYIKFRKVI